MAWERDYDDLLQTHEQLKLQFINTELDLAVTFCEMALGSQDSEKVERNSTNARRAYQAAMKRLGEISVTKPNHAIAEKTKRVEELLTDLKRNEHDGRRNPKAR